MGLSPAPLGFDPADPALRYELVIAAVAASIPADRAVQRIDAAGKLVTPGLIDLHAHLCPHLDVGLPADELVPITATTAAGSAGDAGAYTFGNFRHGVVPQSRTRLFAFVHIASIGLAGGLAPGEMLNIDYAKWWDGTASSRCGAPSARPSWRARSSARCATSARRPATLPTCSTCCGPATCSPRPTAGPGTTRGRAGA